MRSNGLSKAALLSFAELKRSSVLLADERGAS